MQITMIYTQILLDAIKDSLRFSYRNVVTDCASARTDAKIKQNICCNLTSIQRQTIEMF